MSDIGKGYTKDQKRKSIWETSPGALRDFYKYQKTGKGLGTPDEYFTNEFDQEMFAHFIAKLISDEDEYKKLVLGENPSVGAWQESGYANIWGNRANPYRPR